MPNPTPTPNSPDSLPEPLFSKEPDFVNDEGTRWWKSETLTNHAERDLGKNYRVYAAQTAKDDRNYILLDDKNDIVAVDTTLEGMAYKIDVEMLIRRK